jgi:hypothetical protein
VGIKLDPIGGEAIFLGVEPNPLHQGIEDHPYYVRYENGVPSRQRADWYANPDKPKERLLKVALHGEDAFRNSAASHTQIIETKKC